MNISTTNKSPSMSSATLHLSALMRCDIMRLIAAILALVTVLSSGCSSQRSESDGSYTIVVQAADMADSGKIEQALSILRKRIDSALIHRASISRIGSSIIVQASHDPESVADRVRRVSLGKQIESAGACLGTVDRAAYEMASAGANLQRQGRNRMEQFVIDYPTMRPVASEYLQLRINSMNHSRMETEIAWLLQLVERTGRFEIRIATRIASSEDPSSSDALACWLPMESPQRWLRTIDGCIDAEAQSRLKADYVSLFRERWLLTREQQGGIYVASLATQVSASAGRVSVWGGRPVSVQHKFDSDAPHLMLSFDDCESQGLYEFTVSNLSEQALSVVDGSVLSTTLIAGPFGSNMVIGGVFSFEEFVVLRSILLNPLPFQLRVIDVRQ